MLCDLGGEEGAFGLRHIILLSITKTETGYTAV
jgi:hypothetical protein